MLSLRIVTGIIVQPRAFQLFNWGISLRTSSWVTSLGTNEFNEELLRKILNCFLDLIMVLDKLGPIFVYKLLKALGCF